MPPSTKWRSMSVRTDYRLDGNDRHSVCEKLHAVPLDGARASSKRSPFMREHPFLHDFVFCVRSDIMFLFLVDPDLDIILLLSSTTAAAASAIQILPTYYMHRGLRLQWYDNIIMYRVLICVYAAAEVSVFILFASLVIIIIFSVHIITL